MKCQTNQFNCPVEATLSLIGGKYKPLILWHLIDHPLHLYGVTAADSKRHAEDAFAAASRSGKQRHDSS